MQPTFTAGQVWKYHTRPGEESSTVMILKVGDIPNVPEQATQAERTVIHIRILGLSLKNPQSDTGFTHEIGHAPISVQALEQSLISIQSSKPLPTEINAEAQTVVAEWETLAAQGKAGVFTLPVAEIAQAMEDILGQHSTEQSTGHQA